MLHIKTKEQITKVQSNAQLSTRLRKIGSISRNSLKNTFIEASILISKITKCEFS